MDTQPEVPAHFAARDLHPVDRNTPVHHFTPSSERSDGRDRHGNRLFQSSEKGYTDRTGETRAGLLISEQGEALVQRYPHLLQTIDRGLAYMDSLEDPSVVTAPYEIGEGWTIKYLGKGGQSHVTILEHADGARLVLKIKNRDDPRSSAVGQPYINEMLQGQAIAEDAGEVLKEQGVQLPTYYMASGQMICMEYVEGVSPNAEDTKIDHESLFTQINAYIDSHRDDPLWRGITVDSWNTPDEPWSRNFMQTPDGKVVWIDPFVYEPGFANTQADKGFIIDFEFLRIPFKKLAPAPFQLPANDEDTLLSQGKVHKIDVKKLLGGRGEDLFRNFGMASEETKPEERQSTFARNHEAYMQKHAAELPPNPTEQPTVGVVVRSYMELSNGNLTQLLLSAARVNSEPGQFEMIVAVNNPRMYASVVKAMGELGISETEQPTLEQQRQIADHIENSYREEGKELSQFEQNYLSSLRKAEYPSVLRHVAAYHENQATLAVLQVITQTVQHMRESGDRSGIEQAQAQIAHILESQTTLSDAQRQAFIHASSELMGKGIMVIGLDCTSETNGFAKVDLGQASDEGCHVAMSRGAKVLYPIDADFLLSDDGFTEIIEHMKESTTEDEVFYLPLQVRGLQHPEQMKDSESVYLSMLDFYRDIYFYRRQQYGDYISGTHSTGKIMFTVGAFERIGGYSHGDWSEDFSTAGALAGDGITQHYLTHTYQILSHRGREESYDGRNLGGEVRSSPESFAEQSRSMRESAIERLSDLEEQLNAQFAEFADDPVMQDLKTLYMELSEEYFQEEQNTRQWMRRTFLGIDEHGQSIEGGGAFPKVLDAYQQFRSANPDAPMDASTAHHIVENVLKQYPEGSPQQRMLAVFFEQNPLLVYALVRQIDTLRAQTGGDITPEQLRLQLEKDIPELFAPPLSTRPTAETKSTVHAVTDFGHVYLAAQNISAAALNYLREHPDLPEEEVQRLRKIISLARGRGGDTSSFGDLLGGGLSSSIQGSFKSLQIPQFEEHFSQRGMEFDHMSNVMRKILGQGNNLNLDNEAA